MYTSRSIVACLIALSTFVSALPDISRRDDACRNGPASRSCWTPGYSISTNWDEVFPDTGKTVKVNLQVGRTNLSPDGSPREMIVFNGQYPGPTITADWGDTIEITVQNNLDNNGTGIHWHGIRQLHSVQNDGANGITECPIPPGGSRVYTFKATQYGTSWYHSHYSVQYGDGLVGPLIINGPASADYDIDLGPLPLTDWFKKPMFEVLASKPAAPPTSQTILVNGTAGAKLPKIKLTPGKKHRLRFLNTGINNNFHVGIDQHKMTVISADLIPIKPYTADSITLAVGQRYDVIIEANQKVANYYLRIGTGGGRCDGPNAQAAANNTMGALMMYEGAGEVPPSSPELQLPTGCTEEIISPFIATTIPPPPALPSTLAITLDTTAGVFWKVNGQVMDVDWKQPTLQYIMDGKYTLPANDNGVLIEKEGWAYYIITNDTPLPHPLHLHGHDFWVIAEGTGTANLTSKFGNIGTPGAAPTANVNVMSNPSRITNGSPTTIPNGNPSAIPIPNGNPTSILNGKSTAIPNGNPSAIPNGNPTSILNGKSTAIPNGNPTSILNGKPTAISNAGPNASPSLNANANANFNLDNPPRRDTHQVKGNNGVPGAGGYMIIAFKADNPGSWLMHCHIPFHISGGLGLQFVERPSEILGTLGDMSIFTDGCKDWRTFEAGPNPIGQHDSGLKKRMRKIRR